MLTWSIRNIPNFESLLINGELSSVTKEIILSAMDIGLGTVTEENIDEWLIRLRISDTSSPYYLPDMMPPITRNDLTQHIGLTTNVSTTTRSAFMKVISKRIVSDAENHVKRQKENMAEMTN